MDRPNYILLGFENPLLDIQCRPETALLEKYGLEANNAILAEEKHMPLYDEIVKNYEVVYVAGGAAQNTIRGAQVLLPPNSTVYIGAISDDANGDQLRKAAEKDGIRPEYMITKVAPTGLCAVLITGHHRSLVTSLGAAEKYSVQHLQSPSVWKFVEGAKYFYLGAFAITHDGGYDTSIALAKHSVSEGKVFAMNLSAPFLSMFFKKRLDALSKYWDIVFGNETEAEAFAEASGWPKDSIPDIALRISQLPKETSTPRLVVITQGQNPTVVAMGGSVTQYQVNSVNVDDIVDTNGAGDAFCGGFMGLFANGEKNISKCVKAGHWLAEIVIKRVGPTYPPAEARVPFKG